MRRAVAVFDRPRLVVLKGCARSGARDSSSDRVRRSPEDLDLTLRREQLRRPPTSASVCAHGVAAIRCQRTFLLQLQEVGDSVVPGSIISIHNFHPTRIVRINRVKRWVEFTEGPSRDPPLPVRLASQPDGADFDRSIAVNVDRFRLRVASQNVTAVGVTTYMPLKRTTRSTSRLITSPIGHQTPR